MRQMRQRPWIPACAGMTMAMMRRMSVANFIKYGDRTMPMEGLTLEQAKQLMSRHFPELAEPDVKKEEKNGNVTYTFTKKAGRKG